MKISQDVLRVTRDRKCFWRENVKLVHMRLAKSADRPAKLAEWTKFCQKPNFFVRNCFFCFFPKFFFTAELSHFWGQKNQKNIFFWKNFFPKLFCTKIFFSILCPQKVTKFCIKKKNRKKYFCKKQFWKNVFSEKNIFLKVFVSQKWLNLQ